MVSNIKGGIIGLGNPILDISNDTTKESLEKYGLAFGQTIFANDNNTGFFDELEKAPNCSYIPGGSVTNSIRVTKVRYLLLSGCLMKIIIFSLD